MWAWGGRQAGQAYVKGSFQRNLVVGQSGDYKGVEIGAEFRTPSGHGAIVKGIAGYHGKFDRQLDITPSLDKSQKKVTVTARPNPARRSASAGRKITR